jgi:hypothetical protein
MDQETLTRVNGLLASAEALVERESLRQQARQILNDAVSVGNTRLAIQAELLVDKIKRI